MKSILTASTYCGTLALTLLALCLIPMSFGELNATPVVSQVADLKLREIFPRNRFEPRLEGNLVTLQYWFQDKSKEGIEREVSCQIDERRSTELRKGLGLDLCPDNPSGPTTNQPLSACLHGNTIKWQGKPAGFVPSKGHIGQPYAQYMFKRGLRCHEGQLVLDYPALITKAALPFQDCTQKLSKLAGDPASQEYLEPLMAFFLAMKSADVSAVDQGLKKWTGGFLLPTEVITQNTGDCDSKAATFCAVTRKSQTLVIFRSSHIKSNSEHGHAFVGLDVTSSDFPLRDETMWLEEDIEEGDYDKLQPLEFWGRSYIPIDATGPGDTRLGEVVEEKAGKYVAIPIPSGDKLQPAKDESCLVEHNSKAK